MATADGYLSTPIVATTVLVAVAITETLIGVAMTRANFHIAAHPDAPRHQGYSTTSPFGFTSSRIKSCERSERTIARLSGATVVGPNGHDQAAVPAHGLMRRSSGASALAATSVSYATCARSQYPFDRPKNRHRRRSVSAVIARLPATISPMR